MATKAKKQKTKSDSSSTWRSIQQSFSGRAVTSAARKRRWMLNLKFLGGLAGFAFFCFGVWAGIQYLQSESFSRLMAGGSAPVRNVYLQTDGVLDERWLNDRIELPKQIELMAVDIETIQRSISEDGQVKSVLVERVFPDSLRIRIAERQPVLRMVMQDASGHKFLRLISREGVIYPGKRYAADSIHGLLYVSGVALQRKANGEYESLDGIASVADFLQRARALMPERYQEWESISLANYDPTGKSLSSRLTVKTKQGYEITFAPGDMDQQLAELDDILEHLEAQRKRIDLIDLTGDDGRVVLADTQARGPFRVR